MSQFHEVDSHEQLTRDRIVSLQYKRIKKSVSQQNLLFGGRNQNFDKAAKCEEKRRGNGIYKTQWFVAEPVQQTKPKLPQVCS